MYFDIQDSDLGRGCITCEMDKVMTFEVFKELDEGVGILEPEEENEAGSSSLTQFLRCLNGFYNIHFT